MIDYQRQTFQVTVTTWKRDLKGLFDYSAPQEQLKVSTFNISNHCKVYRDPSNSQNYFTTANPKISQYFTFVCKVDLQSSNKGKIFWVRASSNQQNEQNSYNAPYLVLKSNQQSSAQSQCFPLKLGDTVKIGQTQFSIIQLKTNYIQLQTFQENRGLIEKVKENNFETQMNNHTQLDQQTNVKIRKRLSDQTFNQIDNETTRKTFKHKKIKKQQTNKQKSSRLKRDKSQKDSLLEINQEKPIDLPYQQPQDENTMKLGSFLKNLKPQISARKQHLEQQSCKICLSNQQTSIDPFISACNCKGSCSLTHLSCLKSWINSKTEVQNINGVKSYLLKKSSCQICKYPFPTCVQIKDQQIHLIDVELPRNSYMILQSTDPESTLRDQKKYIVIDGERNQITKIGRNHDAQIKIKDITVSRRHAQIVFHKDQFFIKDKKSKFGTLLKLQKDLKFEDQEVNVQMGRCHFRFKPTSRKLVQQKSIQSCVST